MALKRYTHHISGRTIWTGLFVCHWVCWLPSWKDRRSGERWNGTIHQQNDIWLVVLSGLSDTTVTCWIFSDQRTKCCEFNHECTQWITESISDWLVRRTFLSLRVRPPTDPAGQAFRNITWTCSPPAMSVPPSVFILVVVYLRHYVSTVQMMASQGFCVSVDFKKTVDNNTPYQLLEYSIWLVYHSVLL